MNTDQLRPVEQRLDPAAAVEALFTEIAGPVAADRAGIAPAVSGEE